MDHAIHRRRRTAISSFFSARAIKDIEPWIHDKVDLLCKSMLSQQERDGHVEMRVNFLAMTTDMVAAHTLSGSRPQKVLELLNSESDARGWQKTIAAVALLTPIVKQAPWLIPFALRLSASFWMTVAPPLGRIVLLHKVSGFAPIHNWLTDFSTITEYATNSSSHHLSTFD